MNILYSKSGEKYQRDHSHYKHISFLKIKYIHVFSQGGCVFAGGKGESFFSFL